MVCAMPNTAPAITDETTFTLAKELAAAKARCDYAIFLGATMDNHSTIPELASQAAGLKMYLNETFNQLRLKDLTDWIKVPTVSSLNYSCATLHYLEIKTRLFLFQGFYFLVLFHKESSGIRNAPYLIQVFSMLVLDFEVFLLTYNRQSKKRLLP